MPPRTVAVLFKDAPLPYGRGTVNDAPLPCGRRTLNGAPLPYGRGTVDDADDVSPDPVMDAIELIGMSFYGYHGVRAEERTLGQRFVVDVRLELDLAPAGRSDDLERTVNYAQVWQAVREVVEGRPFNLIESVGEQLAANLLGRFEVVEAVRVRVAKPTAPIKGAQVGDVTVELTRTRGHAGS